MQWNVQGCDYLTKVRKVKFPVFLTVICLITNQECCLQIELCEMAPSSKIFCFGCYICVAGHSLALSRNILVFVYFANQKSLAYMAYSSL